MLDYHTLLISNRQLADLGEFLLRNPNCDHTLRQTKRFLRMRNLPVGLVVEWMQLSGAYCDCEVYFNIWLGWEPDER